MTATLKYNDKIMSHYENPRNIGSMNAEDDDVGTGFTGSPACGDVMKLQIKIDDDGTIIDAKFKAFGCTTAIASSSLATEMIKGKTTEEAMKLKNTDIAEELSLPPIKIHCSVLAEDAIKSAIKDWEEKKGKKENRESNEG